MAENPASVVIIGYGNDLRGDDALGPMAAARLEAMLEGQQWVRVETCQGLTPDLAAVIVDANLAIFVDCAATGPAGEMVEREIVPADDAQLSMVHFLDPTALLTWTQKLYGRRPRAVALTVVGECFDISDQLTARVESALAGLVDRAIELAGAASHA